MAGPTLTAAGLTIQSIDAILAEVLSELRANASKPGLLAEPGTPLGSLLLTVADRERLVQELAQALYTAFSIDASGTSLDRIAAAFGIARKSATQSTVSIPVTNGGGAGIVIALGSQVENSDTGDQFSVTAELTLAPAASGTLTVQAIEAGAVPVPAAIAWAWISAGLGAVTFGVNTAGVQGSAAETDAQMRARWLVSLANPGAGPVDAIYAALIGLDGMTECRVYENTTSATGITSPEVISSLPGHSFVAVVRGTATSAAIAQAIHDTKPAGIRSFGATSATVTDAQGVSQTIYWQAAVANNTDVTLNITGSDASYDTAITAAVDAYFAALALGGDVIAQRVACEALDASGPDTTLVSVTLDALAANADKSIAWNEYASRNNITINHI